MGTTGTGLTGDRTAAATRTVMDAVVRTSPLLGALDADDFTAFVQAGHSSSATRGRHLVRAGEDTVAIVLRGVAAERRATRNGGEVVARLLAPGDVSGLTLSLGHGDVGADLIGLTTVSALLLPGGAFRQLVRGRPGCMHAVLRTLAAEHATSLREAAEFDASTTADRVAHRLIELADRFGSTDRGQVHISVPITQEQLASWSRSSRESTAKSLQDLRRAGIVVTGRRNLTILDLPRLRSRHDATAGDQTIRDLLRTVG